jgi:outer membrane lipoprotein-sorting protein
MIATVLALSLLTGADLSVDPKAKDLLDGLAKAWGEVKTATYKMKRMERMRNGKEIREESSLKYRKPNDVYIACTSPCAGQEVIYSQTKNPKQLRVHPGKFPDVTLWLDVHGDLTTKNQHHVIYHTDLGYALDIIARAFKAVQNDPHGEKLEYGGTVTRSGRQGELVRLLAGNRPPTKTQPKKGESFLELGRRINFDPYVMYAANADVSSLNSRLDPDKTYIVPAYYAEKTELMIDPKTGLLLEQDMWNGDGELYEKLEYFDMVPNAPISDLDFDEKNPAYKF